MPLTANKDFIINEGDRLKFDAVNTEIVVQPIIVTMPDGSFTLNLDIKVQDKVTKQQVGAKCIALTQADLIADEPQIANRISADITACEKFTRKQLEEINDKITFTR